MGFDYFRVYACEVCELVDGKEVVFLFVEIFSYPPIQKCNGSNLFKRIIGFAEMFFWFLIMGFEL